LDVLSVIESTLDDPRQVLAAQQFKARGEVVNQLKADGVEYDERMALLEEVTHPKPLEELLSAAYGLYRRGHPWVSEHPFSAKSVVRDMYERAMTFVEYVSFYGLARSEGLVLRYLADAYRAVRQTVPSDAKTEELGDLIEWLGELVRQVDSSLLDEWEKLRNPGEDTEIEDRPPVVTSNLRAFRVLARNALFRRIELAARRDWHALGELDGESGWDAQAWQEALAPYFAEHDEIAADANARGPHLLMIDEGTEQWTVRQVIDDPAGDHDWGISGEIDLTESDEAGYAVLHVTDVGSTTSGWS
jgi:hypothetical protein